MSRAVLPIWLDGPMQSWGVRARWDVRDTGLEPTKSGVIGMLGCALGLRRDDPELERLDQSLRFGVRVDRAGLVATDFHTVTGYHRTAAGSYKHSGGTAKSLSTAMEHGEATVLSPRDYLHDAVFFVGLEGESEEIERLRKALTQPRWPLYLGRKSCVPTRPPLARGTSAHSDLRDALERLPRARNSDAGKLAAYIETTDGPHRRQDATRINPLRMYDFRNCEYLEVDPPCISPD